MVIYLIDIFLFIIINIKCGLAISGNDFVPPIVEVSNGKIEGTWKVSVEGRVYSAFEGIPYAQPPIEELRFEEPQPREPWVGIWKADKQYSCPQIKFGYTTDPFGEEDCLYLNVFVPKTEETKKLDVLVYIHGGAFYTGNSAASIDQKYIMDRDWIVVSINYRLGALGFLSTEDAIVPGNNGLKDQALALKWIQDNIEYFGGNPNSVTLTGFSAGAAAAHLQYFSPWSKGLFHRGWSFSGTAFNGWAIAEEPLEKARRLSNALGCDTTNNKEMVECLRQRPTSLIVEKSMKNMFPLPSVPPCPFAPVIEKGSNNPFLTDYPHKLFQTTQAYDVPWITSTTAQDGFIFASALSDKFDILEEKWSDVAKYVLDYDKTLSDDESTVANKIRKFYLSREGKFDWTNVDLIEKMLTDRYFEIDAVNAAQTQSKLNKSPVYYSKFTYEGTNGWRQFNGVKYDKGTVHGDDMVYYFGALILEPMTKKEIELKNICLDTLYSYVTTGTPIAKGNKWKPIETEFVYLNISGPDIVQIDIKKDFTSNLFWKNLNLLENENIYEQKDEL